MLYPIEWGVLIGGNPAKARYPRLEWINQIAEFVLSSWETLAYINLSLHLCGDHAQRAMTDLAMPEGLNLGAFDRIQVNALDYDVAALGRLSEKFGLDVILQHRGDVFPSDLPPGVFALYDRSRGTGQRPTSWPTRVRGQFIGYAGGMNPENVLDTVQIVTAPATFDAPYWIDMESGVRDVQDRFSLDACEIVARMVFRDLGTFSVREFTQQYPGRFNAAMSTLDEWIRDLKVPSTSVRQLAIEIMTELLGDARVIPRGTVKMPESPQEAQMMCLLGESFLKQLETKEKPS
jgi:hypothetical protein